MPVKALTNKTLEALKPNAKRYECGSACNRDPIGGVIGV